MDDSHPLDVAHPTTPKASNITNEVQDTYEYKAYLFILIPISTGLVVAYDFNHTGIQIQHSCPIILSVASTLDTNPVRSISSIQQPDNPPSRYTTLLNGSTEGME